MQRDLPLRSLVRFKCVEGELDALFSGGFEAGEHQIGGQPLTSLKIVCCPPLEQDISVFRLSKRVGAYS